jgi:hypothetical protein
MFVSGVMRHQKGIGRSPRAHHSANCFPSRRRITGPRWFVWTADPEAIVEKVRRGYHALAAMGRQAG